MHQFGTKYHLLGIAQNGKKLYFCSCKQVIWLAFLPNAFRAFKLFCRANAGTKANQRNVLGAHEAAATQKHFI